jgi:hypothetical protein
MSVLTNRDVYHLWYLGFGPILSGIIEADRVRGDILPISIHDVLGTRPSPSPSSSSPEPDLEDVPLLFISNNANISANRSTAIFSEVTGKVVYNFDFDSGVLPGTNPFYNRDTTTGY